MKNQYKKFRNIILTGMPASGKSTFGKTYAVHSGRYFLDFDRYFEFITKKKIADIFANEGEESFRIQEEFVLKKLEKKHNYVIAMGGGTLCSENNFEFARKLGLIVFLETPTEILSKRILHDKIDKNLPRPLFSNMKTLSEIEDSVKGLWELRKSFYEKAYIHLNTAFSSTDNLKLQLGLYEKKSSERDIHRERLHQKTQKPSPYKK